MSQFDREASRKVSFRGIYQKTNTNSQAKGVQDGSCIYLQTQQFQNIDLDYKDQFALQVISVDQQVPQTTIRVRVRRLDQDTG
jgi:hypothetical protein